MADGTLPVVIHWSWSSDALPGGDEHVKIKALLVKAVHRTSGGLPDLCSEGTNDTDGEVLRDNSEVIVVGGLSQTFLDCFADSLSLGSLHHTTHQGVPGSAQDFNSKEISRLHTFLWSKEDFNGDFVFAFLDRGSDIQRHILSMIVLASRSELLSIFMHIEHGRPCGYRGRPEGFRVLHLFRLESDAS